MKGIELKTGRLLLRTVRPSDAEVIFGYRSRPEVSKYQGSMKSLRHTRRLIELTAGLKPDTPLTWYQLAVLEKESGRLIGDMAIHFKDKENQQAELGYTLAPEYQGKGYATEAVACVIDYLFLELHKHRITASVDPRNKKSVKLLERIGMRKEGCFNKSFWTGKIWADDAVYAVLKEEWPKKCGREYNSRP
ncbi:MAG: GNAT family protein [Elusimicrobia bacterium]|nr:GNAT family protein [Elusimicrobiota bacterium]